MQELKRLGATVRDRLTQLAEGLRPPVWESVVERSKVKALASTLTEPLLIYQPDDRVRQALYGSDLTFYQLDKQPPEWMRPLSYINTLAIMGPQPKKIRNLRDSQNNPVITVTLNSDGPYHQVVISAHPPQTIFPPSVAISPLNPDLPQIQIRLINGLLILNAPTKGVSLRESEKSQPESIFAPQTAQLCTQEVVNQAIGLMPPEERNGITRFWTVHSMLMLIDPNIKRSILETYGDRLRLPSSILIPTELTHQRPQLPPLR